jgi:hypothetical protein
VEDGVRLVRGLKRPEGNPGFIRPVWEMLPEKLVEYWKRKRGKRTRRK